MHGKGYGKVNNLKNSQYFCGSARSAFGGEFSYNARMLRKAIIGLALGVTALSAAQYRETRPIRAVWLRPPASLVSLESYLNWFAEAGITDLYLETFYHGLSTGKQGVFNARFGFDYLAATIPLAAKYGIRTHAWLEAAYWQYDTTGAYLFAANPEYRVINVANNAPGGDVALQVFANLTHPGVQQKLRQYTAELAAYNGLWGIQTDYHRFPIDNNTSDNFRAPWSYDSTSNAAMQALYGSGVNITSNAARTNHTYWNQFLAWRRQQISEAARQMYLGIQGVNPDVVFSGAVFPSAMTSSAQLSKCQDWPSWCVGGYIDHIVPMCYSSTTTSIKAEIDVADDQLSGKRMIPGLATGGTSPHPPLGDQLTALREVGYEDYALFEGLELGNVTARTAAKNHMTSGPKYRGDTDNDNALEVPDWQRFWTIYRGIPINGAATTNRYNYDGDTDVDSADHAIFREQFRRFRFGENGVFGTGDQLAWTQAIGASVSPTYRHLYDIDTDGDVDQTDLDWAYLLAPATPMVFGTLSLGDTTLAPNRRFLFEWLDGSGNVVASYWFTADTQGRFAVPSPGAGTYRLSVKHEHWLRRSVSVTIGTADVPGVPVSLVNGDADGDNSVSIFDYIQLSAGFDLNVGDPGFDPMADLDEDGSVTIFDVIVVNNNFDLFGD